MLNEVTTTTQSSGKHLRLKLFLSKHLQRLLLSRADEVIVTRWWWRASGRGVLLVGELIDEGVMRGEMVGEQGG